MRSSSLPEVGGRAARLVVMHTLAPGAAAELAGSLTTKLPAAAVEIAPFTPVMSIHTGPGLLGIAWQLQGNGAASG